MSDGIDPVKRTPLVKALLWLVPLWLLLSAGAAIWIYFRSEDVAERKETLKFAKSVSPERLQTNKSTLADRIGIRSTETNSGEGLSRAASWIEGSLGPSNTGYTVTSVSGPERWPLLMVTEKGNKPELPSTWVIISYDQDTSHPENSDASLLAGMAAAQAMAGEKLSRSVHFVFIPHEYGDAEKVAATREKLAFLIGNEGGASSVLCLQDMGGGFHLQAAPYSTTNPVLKVIPSSFGKLTAADKHYSLPQKLHEANLPTVRISSVAADEHETEDLARLTGQLIELIRRISSEI